MSLFVGKPISYWIDSIFETDFSSSINDVIVDVALSGAGSVGLTAATCIHLGCIVNWNAAEKSWDFPYHNARFNDEGKVLHAPAIADLDALGKE